MAFIQLSVNVLSQVVVLKAIGAGQVSDAYMAAQALPAVISSILIVAFQSVWLPVFVKAAVSKYEWLEVQGNAQLFLLIPTFLTGLLLWISMNLWIPVLFPGFNNDQLQLTSLMTPLFLFASALSCHSGLYITALRSINKYYIAELIPLFVTVFFLVGIYFLIPIYGIVVAAYLAILRSLIITILLHFFVGRPKYNFSVLTNKNQLINQLTVILTGSSLFKTSPLVDRYWSSHAASGGLTIYNLAITSMGAISSVFDRSVCVPNVSQISKAVANHDYKRVKRLYRYSITEITVISMFIEAMMYFSYPIFIYILSTWVNLTNTLATDVWLLCMLLIGYTQASAAGSIIVGSFYAMGDMRTPMRIGFIGFVLSLLVKSIFFLFYGLKGMAFATSLYYVFNALVMFILLERKVNARLS